MKRVVAKIESKDKDGEGMFINIPADRFIPCDDGFIYIYNGDDCVAMVMKDRVITIHVTQEGNCK